LLISCGNAWAYRQVPSDTTLAKHILDELATRPLKPSDYRLSKDEFIERYGFDETSKKSISHHFQRRTRNIYLIFGPAFAAALGLLVALIMLVVLIALGPVFIIAFIESIAELIVTLYYSYLILYIVGWILRIWGITDLIVRSKKKLLLKLVEYRKTGQFPDKIKKYKGKKTEE
jgi:hypothetical protein